MLINVAPVAPRLIPRSPAVRRVAPPAVRMVRRRRWGLAGPLEDAQAKLTAAGYENVTCRTERISLPLPDPATGLTYYDQNYCSAPGYVGGFQVEAVNRMGVQNLAAERASLGYNPNQAGYFQNYGAGNQVLNTTSSTASSGSPQQQGVYPVFATLRNLSRSGGEMRVGDRWQLEISGKPSSTVSVVASHNGAQSSSNFGTTDGAGRLLLSGQFDAGTIGSWTQTWSVSGQSATVNFTVLPAAGSGSSSTSSNGTNTGNNNQQNQTGQTLCPQVLKTCPNGTTVGYDPAIKTGCVYLPCPGGNGGNSGNGESWLDKKLNIGGFEIPMVAAAAAGALGVMYMMGGRR